MNLAMAINNAISNYLSGVHTSIPAKVVSYDSKTHLATVLPTVRVMADNGVEYEIPQLERVPVIFPAAGAFDIEFPIAKDDAVLLIFCEADISAWVQGNGTGIVSPGTSARFGLNNAVALPGLLPTKKEGSVRLFIDDKGVLTLQAKKIVLDGQVIGTGDMIARGDVFAGPAPTGPGVSLTQHLHPTPTGPSSAPAPPTPIPPEVV